MKKSILSIFAISALLFTSCTEDRGTSSESTAQQGDVSSEHLNEGYGNQATGTFGGADESPEMMWMNRAEDIAAQMGTELQLDRDKQDEVQQIIYERERKLGELENDLNYNETARMGGETNNDTQNDMNTNNNTNMDASRSNNAGNVYNNEDGMNDAAATGSSTAETDMNTAKKQIKSETDRELQGVLSAEQFRMYKQNKDKYGGADKGSASGKSNPDGSMNKQHQNK